MSGPQVHTEGVAPPPALSAEEARRWLGLQAPQLLPRTCGPLAPDQQAMAAAGRQLLHSAYETLIQAGMAKDPQERERILQGFAAQKAAADKVLTSTVNTVESAASSIPIFGAFVLVAGEILKAVGTAQSVAAPSTFEQAMRQSPSYRGFSFYPHWVQIGGPERPNVGGVGHTPGDLQGFVDKVDRTLTAYGQLFGADLFCVLPRDLDQAGRTLADWPADKLLGAVSAAGGNAAGDQITDTGRLALIRYQFDEDPRYLLEALPDPASPEFAKIAGTGGVQAFVDWLRTIVKGATAVASTPTSPPAGSAAPGAGPAAAPHEQTWREAAAQGVHAFGAWLKAQIAGQPATAKPATTPAPTAPAPAAPPPKAAPAAPAPAAPAAPAPKAAPASPAPGPAEQVAGWVGALGKVKDLVKDLVKDDGGKAPAKDPETKPPAKDDSKEEDTSDESDTPEEEDA